MTNGNSVLSQTSEFASWRFLTNHAHVLLAVARDPNATMREVATAIGITERATQKIIADLERDGYITRSRHGRRNSYTVARGRALRHPLNAGYGLDELLSVLVSPRK